jgi:hypothetical protein
MPTRFSGGARALDPCGSPLTPPAAAPCPRSADRVTSVLVPASFAAVGVSLLAQGLYHMYTGTGKLE